MLATDLSYNLWLELCSFAPPVLQPTAYRVIKTWLGTTAGEPVLHTLLGGDGELPAGLAEWYKPGWQEFYDNFDKVMNFYLHEYKPYQRASSRNRSAGMEQFIATYRDILFVTKFPILNATLHLMTSNGDLHYLDPTAKLIVELIVNISVAEYQYHHGVAGEDFINQALFEIYSGYEEYTTKVLKLRLVGNPAKRGYIRQVSAGFRSHWSFRGIVTPIREDHEGDELHIPWRIGVICLKLEILNLLMSRAGLSLDQALRKHTNATICYDQDVADIMEILIAECEYKGLPVLFNRNPSMRLGAIQLLFVTKVLPESNAIGISPMVLSAPKHQYQRMVA